MNESNAQIVIDNKKPASAEIEQQIHQLRQQLQAIRREEIAEHMRRSKVHVGRCFRSDREEYVLVTDVPRPVERMEGIGYNEYQFSALWLSDELIPFKLDKVHSSIWTEKSPILFRTYQEISPQEFLGAFEARVQRLRAMVERMIAERIGEQRGTADQSIPDDFEDSSPITKQFYVRDEKAFEKLLRDCAQALPPSPPVRNPLEAGRIALQNFVLHPEQDSIQGG